MGKALHERQLAGMKGCAAKVQPAQLAALPRLPGRGIEPAVFDLTTRLVHTFREPCRTGVKTLRPGQPLRLRRDCSLAQSGPRVVVETHEGCIVGYLGADVASYLSILLDYGSEYVDRSYAANIVLAAPPDDPGARRLRYPKLDLHIRLELTDNWPLLVIIAVIGLKSDQFAERFNLAGNAWLQPVERYRAEYRQQGHDFFALPAEMAKAWILLTRGHAQELANIAPLPGAGEEYGNHDSAIGGKLGSNG